MTQKSSALCLQQQFVVVAVIQDRFFNPFPSMARFLFGHLKTSPPLLGAPAATAPNLSLAARMSRSPAKYLETVSDDV